jgi:hypothetical protein
MRSLGIERAGGRESDYQSRDGVYCSLSLGHLKLDVIFVNDIIAYQVHTDFRERRSHPDERPFGLQVVHHVHLEEAIEGIVIASA